MNDSLAPMLRIHQLGTRRYSLEGQGRQRWEDSARSHPIMDPNKTGCTKNLIAKSDLICMKKFLYASSKLKDSGGQ